MHKFSWMPGWEWREPGCSRCNGSNGEAGCPRGNAEISDHQSQLRKVSGTWALTHIMSPAMVVPAAVHGPDQRRARDVSPMRPFRFSLPVDAP